MKKIIPIVSVFGLLLANSVSADIISPGPIGQVAMKVGLWHEYSTIKTLMPLIFFVIVIIFIVLFITRKIEKRIKEKKNKDNIIVK